jgi:hypothetical protein
LPFFFAMLAVLMCITYVPAVSLWLPVQTQQIKAEDVKSDQFLRSPAVDRH